MKKINLRDYYPFYVQDVLVELPDQIVAAMKPYKQEEETHRRRMRRNKVYSLDYGDLKNKKLTEALSPCELCARKQSYQELYTLISHLPEKQKRRIYAYFIKDMSMYEIARLEGVSKMAVCAAIKRGLKQMQKQLEKFK